MRSFSILLVFILASFTIHAQSGDSLSFSVLTSLDDLETGEKLFKNNCVSCHGKKAGGNEIGPNLTDNYWINGGSDQDIYTSVKRGHINKGMPGWENNLTDEENRQVTSYVISLIGSKPKNAKPPQGDYYLRDEIEAIEEEATEEVALEEIFEEADNWFYDDTAALNNMISVPLNLEDDDDFTSFSMLDSVLDNYRVFFIGENHLFRSSNRKMQLKMFKYLHKNAGVRTLFIELGFSRGYLMNEYIQTGDTSIFNILEDYSFDIYSEFYKDLREFNETLDSNEKIKVIGIDVERFHGLSVKLLSMLFPEGKHVPDSISLHVESIIGLASYQDDSYSSEERDYYWGGGYSARNTLDAIFENFDAHKDIYREYVGAEKFPIMEKVIQTLKDKKTYDEYDNMNMPQGYVYREQYMYKSFIEYIREHPDEKFFGQFGRCHVSRSTQDEACSWHMFNSIANRLYTSPDTTLTGKVLTIGSIYTKSSIYDDDLEEFPNLESIVEKVEENDYSLIKITQDSLFENLNDKYNFMIINNLSIDDTDDAYAEEEIYDFDDFTFEMRFSGYFGYEFLFAKFDNLNNFFTNLGLEEEVSPINFLNFGLDVYDKGGFYWGMEYAHYTGHNTSITDSIDIDLSGYRVMMYAGKDLFQKKWISLIPRSGIGYSELKMKITQEAEVENIFGETNTKVYKNPAFVLDLGFDARFSYKLASLGFKGGFLWDMSNQRWINNEQIVENSPEQSLTGFYAGAVFSLYFSD